MSQSFILTGLYAAARAGKQKAVEDLLLKEVDVNQRDRDGNAAVMWAAWGGHYAVLKTLCQAGADASAVNDKGATALHW